MTWYDAGSWFEENGLGSDEMEAIFERVDENSYDVTDTVNLPLTREELDFLKQCVRSRLGYWQDNGQWGSSDCKKMQKVWEGIYETIQQQEDLR